MTLFEYLAIAFGLLYSVAALRVLGGLPAAIGASERSPLHLTLTFVMSMLIAISFWSFWSAEGVEWTFAGFFIALLVPGLLYYCAAVVVPENPEGVSSWREHYFATRRRWYGGFGLWSIAAALSATVNLGMPLNHPARIIHVTAFAVGVAGFLSPNPRFHTGLVIVMALLVVAGAFGPGLEPGWLAVP